MCCDSFKSKYIFNAFFLITNILHYSHGLQNSIELSVDRKYLEYSDDVVSLILLYKTFFVTKISISVLKHISLCLQFNMNILNAMTVKILRRTFGQFWTVANKNAGKSMEGLS